MIEHLLVFDAQPLPLQNADNILDKATGPNSDKQAVEQAIQAITNMEQALNGAQNLHDAQTQAIQTAIACLSCSIEVFNASALFCKSVTAATVCA
jgi:hypothetical protein